MNEQIIKLANCEIIRCEAFQYLKEIATKYFLPDFEGWYWSLFISPSYFEYSDSTNEYVLPYNPKHHLLKAHTKWNDDKVSKFLDEINSFVSIGFEKIEDAKSKLEINEFIVISDVDISITYNNRQVVVNTHVYKKLLNSIGYRCFDETTNNLLIWCLIFRHKYLGIYNRSSQLSVHPHLIKYLVDNFDLKAELFGSAFNHTTISYGSLFLDIECYFNSIGNFFDNILGEGVYEVNPPFVTSVITHSVDLILEKLKGKTKVEFILILPVWDYKGQQMLKNTCRNYRYEPGEYEEMKCFEAMNKSEFLKEHFIVCDEVMKYYDYFNNRTINHVSPTHIYYLSNTYVSYQKKNLLKKYFDKSIKNNQVVVCRT